MATGADSLGRALCALLVTLALQVHKQAIGDRIKTDPGFLEIEELKADPVELFLRRQERDSPTNATLPRPSSIQTNSGSGTDDQTGVSSIITPPPVSTIAPGLLPSVSASTLTVTKETMPTNGSGTSEPLPGTTYPSSSVSWSFPTTLNNALSPTSVVTPTVDSSTSSVATTPVLSWGDGGDTPTTDKPTGTTLKTSSSPTHPSGSATMYSTITASEATTSGTQKPAMVSGNGMQIDDTALTTSESTVQRSTTDSVSTPSLKGTTRITTVHNATSQIPTETPSLKDTGSTTVSAQTSSTGLKISGTTPITKTPPTRVYTTKVLVTLKTNTTSGSSPTTQAAPDDGSDGIPGYVVAVVIIIALIAVAALLFFFFWLWKREGRGWNSFSVSKEEAAAPGWTETRFIIGGNSQVEQANGTDKQAKKDEDEFEEVVIVSPTSVEADGHISSFGKGTEETVAQANGEPSQDMPTGKTDPVTSNGTTENVPPTDSTNGTSKPPMETSAGGSEQQMQNGTQNGDLSGQEQKGTEHNVEDVTQNDLEMNEMNPAASDTNGTVNVEETET